MADLLRSWRHLRADVLDWYDRRRREFRYWLAHRADNE